MTQKILVVEDDPSVQSVVCFKLRTSGFEVFKANNGEEALAELNKTRVDLILVDLMMPVMSGKEFLVAMKKSANTKDIPVIILTGKTLENEVIEGLALGADDYIKKPFSPAELMARVHNVLSRVKR
jgi:DNA-binding response OmpR family regulator